MKKLTIGYFLEHYDPFVSGVITSVKGLSNELQARGHNVYIICPKAGNYQDTAENIIRLPSISTRYLENATIGLPSPLSKRKLARLDFDLIHSQDIFYSGGMGMQLARRIGVPYVQTYHTLWDKFVEQYKLNPLFKSAGAAAMVTSYPFYFGLGPTANLFKNTLTGGHPDKVANMMWNHMVNMGNFADQVIVPSKHLKAALKAGGMHSPVEFIPNGITPFARDVDNLLPPRKKQELRLLSVARLSTEKRVDALIGALHLLNNPQATLIIVGEGPAQAYLQAKVVELGLSRQVRFMGSLSNAAVRQIMRESDIFCLASHDFDNHPMVFAEAIEARLPIVYCDPKLAGGLSPANSVLAGRDSRGLAAAIKHVNKTRQLKMSQASQALVARYSVASMADETLRIYKQLLA